MERDGQQKQIMNGLIDVSRQEDAETQRGGDLGGKLGRVREV